MNKKEQDIILKESKLDTDEIRYTFDEYKSGKMLGLFNYQLQMIIKGMKDKYNHSINKYGKYKFNLSKDKNNYYFHIIIHSESLERMSYDTIIQLTRPDENEKDLSKYYIKLFCNSPSFTFTFAYVVNDAGLLADGTEVKIRKTALTTPPATKNPGLMLGFDKFIFMACEFLGDNGLLNADVLEKDYAKSFVPYTEVLKSIPDEETKLIEYQIKHKNRTAAEKKYKRKTAVKNDRTRTTSSKPILVRSKNKQNEIESSLEHKEKVARAKANNNQKFTNGTKKKIKGSKLKPKKKIGK